MTGWRPASITFKTTTAMMCLCQLGRSEVKKTCLYSAESIKFWHFPQSIGYFFCSSNWHFEYLPYNSNWNFEKQLFLSELSIYYNRNHILSSKSVIFYTFFFYRTWLRDFKNLVRNIYLTVNQTDTSLFRNMFLCSTTFRFHTYTSFRTSCTNTMRISASTCR